MITKNEAHPNNELLEDDVTSIQDICFFLKTFCAETELHTQLLKSKSKDETSVDIIEEQLDTEYKLPENPNEVYPFELYPEIFTYETIDPEKCKLCLFMLFMFYSKFYFKKCLQSSSDKKKSFLLVT